MRFRKSLTWFLVLALMMSVVSWPGEISLAEGVSANEMTVSENNIPVQEENDIKGIQERAPVDIVYDPNEDGGSNSSTILANGTDGGISWVVYESGELLVSGTGDRSSTSNEWPWYQYRDNIISASILSTDMTDVSCMFSGCSNLVSVDLSNLDTSNVTTMNRMFENCSSLVNLDLSGLNTSKVTDIGSMFYRCSKLVSLNLSGVDGSKWMNTIDIFNDCDALSIIQCPLNLQISIATPSNMVWHLADGTEITEFPQHLSDSVTIFRDNDNIASGIEGGITWIIDKNGKLTVSGKGDVTNYWPWGEYNEQIISAEINVTEMTNTSGMFAGCKNLTSVDLSGFHTENVTNTSSMFSECSSLINLDLSNFHTENVTEMGSMFIGCYNLTELDLSNFNTSNVTTMNAMFNACTNLVHLDIHNFQTENVTNMSDMFGGCYSLSSLDLGSFHTGNVTDMSHMFYMCESLVNLDLSSFDTRKVTDMGFMFYDCAELENLNINSFETDSIITTSDNDSMNGVYAMFYNCLKLKALDLGGFKTENISNMEGMFTYCTSLINLDLSSFNMANVTRANDMLLGCNALTTIDTPYNLTFSIKLPFVDGEVWKTSDGTELSELPKNANNSIIIKREKKIPITDGSDNWFLVTGVVDYQDIYIAENNDHTVLDTLFDKMYNNAYQTLFINDSSTDLKKLIPIFEHRSDAKVYVNDSEQISGKSEQNFSQGCITYNVSNSEESRNYQVRFVKKENGPRLFVNGPSNREVYLTDYFNNIHDILIANVGDETLTGIKVELLDAAHVKLDNTITTGLGNNNTLSAFTRIPSADESASVMTNFGKIRLLPDGEGEIQGTLVILADGQAPVYIELSGYSSNPKITTTTADLNMEDVVRVKYVPYSYTVETNNIDTENTITFSLEEGRLAEGLQIYPATGEIYGVPLETGEFPIKVKATYSRPEYLPSYADITLTVKDNTDGNVYNASDKGYELVRAVGKETSSGSNDFVLTRKGNQLFVSAGPYHEFIDFWLNGQKLVEGEDYTKESGSTRITVRAQTFANKADAEGTNTFAAEFRTAGDSRDNLRRTAQNFRINFKKGSGSKSRSGSEGKIVVTTATVSSNVSFAMRLVNPAGLPLSGLTIEVHSTPKVSQTNQNGMATFYDVESGTHTLFVKDKDGNILASTNFEILFGDMAKLQNTQLTVKSGSRFTLDTQLEGNVLTFVNLQEGDAYRILSADTSDNTNIAIWFVLMFVSGGIGFNIYRDNRRKIYRK